MSFPLLSTARISLTKTQEFTFQVFILIRTTLIGLGIIISAASIGSVLVPFHFLKPTGTLPFRKIVVFGLLETDRVVLVKNHFVSISEMTMEIRGSNTACSPIENIKK
jgi:hypothetical protein